MDDALAARFEGFEGAEGASPEAVAKIEEVFGRRLPRPLLEILLEADLKRWAESSELTSPWQK